VITGVVVGVESGGSAACVRVSVIVVGRVNGD